MAKHKSITKTFSQHRRRIGYGILLLAFMLIGAAIIAATRAASDSFVALEPEVTAKGPVDTFPSSNASGQSYISFSQQTALSVTQEARNAGSLASELNIASNGSWTWGAPISTNGADTYRMTMNAPTSTTGKYYWASSFVWTNNPGVGGYIGLQTNVAPLSSARGVIFSMWNTEVAENIGSGIAQPFGGEGVGMQTAQRLNWDWNKDYEVYITRIASRSNASHNWWLGYVRDTVTNTITEIGRIRTPASWGYMIPNNSFFERYGSSNTCTAIPPASGEFKHLRAKSGSKYYSPNSAKVEIRQYTTCSNVISSSNVTGGFRVQINSGTN